MPALDVRVLDEHELGRVRAEEEQREEDKRCGSQDGQERADRPRLPVEQRAESSGRGRDDERAHSREARVVREHVQGDHCDQAGHEDDVEHIRRGAVEHPHEQLHGEQRERRHKGHGQREEDDLRARRAPDGEELGVLSEDVEQRLREREP